MDTKKSRIIINITNSMGKIGPTGIFGYMQDSALRDRKGSVFSY
jgi:hypothetical protein